MSTERYQLSQEMLTRALKSIPLGSQTFSKSNTQYPKGVSPHFISRGKGSYVWDVDGNKYIDFVNSLGAITLGYNDPDVNDAVQNQLESGTIFSLAHPLELQVAEKIIEMVPCAEMVRFGKNGSDATSGAIRLARAFTQRDHVAVCGYHGWQDWYIGSTARNLGVPKAVQALTHTFQYNNINSLEQIFSQYPEQIAAVILEPMSGIFPENNFLHEVKNLTHHHHSVLIFDEVVTGFRYANGGAQEYFNVIPDLATFGKGLANGYPLSAIAGRADMMALMQDIFYSFTFGGETLSLAAAFATLNKLQTQPILTSMHQQGDKLFTTVNQLIEKHKLNEFIKMIGHSSQPLIIIKDTKNYTQWQIKTLFLQEIFARGILFIGAHNMSYTHRAEDIVTLLAVYDEVFKMMNDAILNNKLTQYLHCEPLIPLFKIR